MSDGEAECKVSLRPRHPEGLEATWQGPLAGVFQLQHHIRPLPSTLAQKDSPIFLHPYPPSRLPLAPWHCVPVWAAGLPLP